MAYLEKSHKTTSGLRVGRAREDLTWADDIAYKLVFLQFAFVTLISITDIPRLVTIKSFGSSLISLALLATIAFGWRRRIAISPIFVYLFLGYLLVMIAGWIINQVQPGVLANGLRIHLQYAPFFLAPLVLNFPEERVRRLAWFVLIVAIVQAPVTVLQRFVLYPHLKTGDVVTGTIGEAQFLSVFITSCVAVLYAWYLNGSLSLRNFLLLVIFLLIPTGINDTRGTLIILPVGIFGAALIVNRVGRPALFRTLILAVSLVFVVSGAYWVAGEVVTGRTDLFKRVHEELFNREVKKVRGHDEMGDKLRIEEMDVGRLYSVQQAWKNISKDPLVLVVGMGAGNLAKQTWGPIAGKYSEYNRLGPRRVAVSFLMWEVGILGLAIYIWFLIAIWFSCINVARRGGWLGLFASGWGGCVAVMGISFMYKPVTINPSLFVLFLFFSGVIVRASVARDRI